MKPRGGNQIRGRGTFNNRGMRTPINRGGVQRSRIQFNTTSSSDTSDINADIPMINAPQETRKAVLLSSESSYYSDVDDNTSSDNRRSSTESGNLQKVPKASSSIGSKSNSESSSQENQSNYVKKQYSTPVINLEHHHKHADNLNVQKSSTKKDESYEPEVNVNKSSSRPEIKSNITPNYPEKNQHFNSNLSLNENPSSNNIYNVNQNANLANNNNNNSNNNTNSNYNINNNSNNNTNSNYNINNNSNNNNNNNNNNSNSYTPTTSIQSNETKHSQSSNELRIFTLLHEKSTLLKKETFRFLENHKIIYYSMEGKDNIGHFTIISNQTTCVVDGPGYLGIVRCNNKGNKYLLVSSLKKPHDDREGEICGIFFKDSNVGKKKTKSLNIAINLDRNPYFSISKRLSLTTIATGETEAPPNVIKFTSKPPEINEKGKLTLNLGDVCLVPSTKNIIMCNEKGENILIFYKISEGSFRVHVTLPITPLIAFALSISIVKTF